MAAGAENQLATQVIVHRINSILDSETLPEHLRFAIFSEIKGGDELSRKLAQVPIFFQIATLQ